MDHVAERHDRETAADDADGEHNEEDAGDIQGFNSCAQDGSRASALGSRSILAYEAVRFASCPNHPAVPARGIGRPTMFEPLERIVAHRTMAGPSAT
jgi:hypothetical protein